MKPANYAPVYDGPHRDHMGNALGPRTYERPQVDLCIKCRTRRPCNTARSTMGDDLRGFGPEPGNDDPAALPPAEVKVETGR